MGHSLRLCSRHRGEVNVSAAATQPSRVKLAPRAFVLLCRHDPAINARLATLDDARVQTAAEIIDVRAGAAAPLLSLTACELALVEQSKDDFRHGRTLTSDEYHADMTAFLADLKTRHAVERCEPSSGPRPIRRNSSSCWRSEQPDTARSWSKQKLVTLDRAIEQLLTVFSRTKVRDPDLGLVVYPVTDTPFIVVYDVDAHELRLHFVFSTGAGDRLEDLDPSSAEW
jgi:hypothetical protein